MAKAPCQDLQQQISQKLLQTPINLRCLNKKPTNMGLNLMNLASCASKAKPKQNCQHHNTLLKLSTPETSILHPLKSQHLYNCPLALLLLLTPLLPTMNCPQILLLNGPERNLLVLLLCLEPQPSVMNCLWTLPSE